MPLRKMRNSPPRKRLAHNTNVHHRITPQESQAKTRQRNKMQPKVKFSLSTYHTRKSMASHQDAVHNARPTENASKITIYYYTFPPIPHQSHPDSYPRLGLSPFHSIPAYHYNWDMRVSNLVDFDGSVDLLHECPASEEANGA